MYKVLHLSARREGRLDLGPFDPLELVRVLRLISLAFARTESPRKNTLMLMPKIIRNKTIAMAICIHGNSSQVAILCTSKQAIVALDPVTRLYSRPLTSVFMG